MNISRGTLDDAAKKGVISEEQANNLWKFINEQSKDNASFSFTHVLYYLGGLIAIGAMSLFMTIGWESFGGFGLFFISAVYAGGGLWLTEYFLKEKKLPVPAGLTATFVVVLTPLAVYGLQNAFGWWAGGMAYRDYHTIIDWRWIMMELATLMSGAVLLWRYRLPFMVMPVAVTLWYMSMDIVPFIFGGAVASWDFRRMVSLWFGLLMAIFAFYVDIRTRHEKDFAFWLYLFGVLAFWGGLSTMNSGSEFGKFIYMCINIIMIVVGAIISRRVFAVFGGLGVTGYLGHLAYGIFRDSILFPFALTLIGLGVIGLGILWQRHEESISGRLRSILPAQIRELIELRR